jgi:SAM-dependent methyltransferase
MESEKVEAQIAHFNAIAGRYFTARQHRNHLLLKDLLWDHVFERNDLSSRSPNDVLEPMCGYADGKRILERRLRTEFSYQGFDYSENVIDRLRSLDPTLNVSRADVTTFEPSRESYDLIILLGGLHHVPEAAPDVVVKLAAALRPGGVLINLEPTNGNPITRRIRERIYESNSLFDEKTERAFAVDALLRMFRTTGLESVDVLYPGLISYVLYYNPDAFPRLNRGGAWAVRLTFALDRLVIRSALARILSFATLTIWRKSSV